VIAFAIYRSAEAILQAVPMSYLAKAVANEFLSLVKADGKTVSPMKLLKLVFFAHGWYLAFTKQPLIQERVGAWQYGPVIPDLYQAFKRFGNDPITEEAKELRIQDGKLIFYIPRIQRSGDDTSAAEAKALIEKVWKTYGKHSAAQLSNATHLPGTPWEKTYRPGVKSLIIPDDVIRDYYDGLKAGAA
jgi:uncharacterized phage-associated protein